MNFEGLIVLSAIILLAVFFAVAFVKENAVRGKKTPKIIPYQTEKDEEAVLQGNEDWLNEGKIDERMFEIGDSEAERPVIDIDSRQYFQNLGDKLKQDEAMEMLNKMTEENTSKKMNFKDLKAEEQARQKQSDREAHNKRMLDKLKGYRIKKKIAKKAAQKNIQLDEKMIEKIKLRALAGKMR